MRLALYALTLAALATVNARPAKRNTSPYTVCAPADPVLAALCVCANTAAGVTFGSLGSFSDTSVAAVASSLVSSSLHCTMQDPFRQPSFADNDNCCAEGGCIVGYTDYMDGNGCVPTVTTTSTTAMSTDAVSTTSVSTTSMSTSTATGGMGTRKRHLKYSLAAACAAEGKSACSVAGTTRHECVDTDNDVESCGGCMFVSPSDLEVTRGGQNITAPLGKDCTSLPNAGDVSCQYGSCVIESCAAGFRLNRLTNTCIESQSAALKLQKYRL